MRITVALVSVFAVFLGVFVVLNDVPLTDPGWWLTNETPPRVSLEAPTGPLRGSAEGRVVLDRPDRQRIISVRVDDQPREARDQRIFVDTTGLTDGQHRVDVQVRDTSRRQNLASTVWTFSSDNTSPRLDATLDPAEGPQAGRTFVIRVRSDEPVPVLHAFLNDRPLPLQTDGQRGFWALGGVSPDPPERQISLRLDGTDAVGNAGVWQNTWPIRSAVFDEDDLTIEPTEANRTARLDEDRELGALYTRADSPRHWTGVFRMPVRGEITTEFGTHRSYEYHPGLDVAAALGTPVVAPADGVVVFVGAAPARGNLLVLDHGAGVYTTYAHLQRTDVAPGASVRAGQTVATVGSTGFSTGPHLHWEMWVGGANVDPMDWTRRAFP